MTSALHALAQNTLRTEYGIAATGIELISQHSFNSIFSVRYDRDQQAVLRVGTSLRIHQTGIEDVEAQWLDELAEAGLPVARNLRALDGRRWVLGSSNFIDGERVCTFFQHLDGFELRQSPREITPDRMRQAGVLLGQIHAHGAACPESNPTLVRRSAIHPGPHDAVSRHSAMLAEAVERAQRFEDQLWDQSDAHRLHGDFGPHNLLLHGDALSAIDFQDMRLGPSELDLGVTVSDLERSTPHAVTPFLNGYKQVRSLPDWSPQDREAHAALRSLAIVNLALVAPATNIASAFDRHAAVVQQWMASPSG